MRYRQQRAGLLVSELVDGVGGLRTVATHFRRPPHGRVPIMILTEEDDYKLSLGGDIVECLIGKPCSHGEMVVNQIHFQWRATVNCVAAERFFRKAAKLRKVRITYFRSQNL